MKTVSILLASLLVLAGCANTEYSQYVEAQSKIEAQIATVKSNEAVARYNAEAAKYKAMADIAASGTESAKVAAVMALALGGQQNSAPVTAPRTQLQAPPPNQALAWASVLVPSTVQLFGIAANARVAMSQSDNARDVALSTNNTFAGMGNSIQAAGTAGLTSTENVAIAGLTSNQTIANYGLTATQNTATAGLTATQNTATAGLAATQAVATTGMSSLVTVANAPPQTAKICSVNPVTSVMTCN